MPLRRKLFALIVALQISGVALIIAANSVGADTLAGETMYAALGALGICIFAVIGYGLYRMSRPGTHLEGREELHTFDVWLRHQAVDPARLTPEQLKNWQRIYRDARVRAAAPGRK